MGAELILPRTSFWVLLLWLCERGVSSGSSRWCESRGSHGGRLILLRDPVLGAFSGATWEVWRSGSLVLPTCW